MGPALVGLILGAVSPAGGATTVFTATAGDQSWFSAGNWAPSVPTAGDLASFAGVTSAFVEGSTAAVAANLVIAGGGVTIGDFNPGTLNVGGQVSVTGGRLSLNFGTLSLNTLAVGTAGTYSDTRTGTLVLTGSNPTIRMAAVGFVVNSQISGSSGLNTAGPGTLVLGNDNSYTGGTVIGDTLTLQIGNGGTTGTLGAGDVTNNGTLVMGRSDSAVISNLITGPGSLRQSGSGTVTLVANNTYSGGTLINSGAVQVGDGGTSGALGSGGIINNSRLIFSRSDTVSVGDAISGIGSVTQAGPGIVVLTGDNSYSGGTTISSGRLQVGSGGTSGALGAGPVSNGAALVFDRSDNIVVGGAISGPGTLEVAGTGTVVVTGSNTYSGKTTISRGTLQVGNGGITGSLGSGGVSNESRLVFNRSDNIAIATLIEGSGSVRHSGSGLLVLTANNTYQGGTTVDGGGTLGVTNGSAFGPGDLNLSNGTIRTDSISLTNRTTINVGGNYTQSADTVLELGVAGAGANEFDRVRVAGRAVVGGSLRLGVVGTYRPVHNTNLVLLSATGGVTGRFSALAFNFVFSPLLAPQLLYNPNDVTLSWAHASFLPYAGTPNQRAVAEALDSIVTSTAAGDMALIDHLDYEFLANLQDGLGGAIDAMVPVGLTALHGTSFAVLDLQADQFLKRTGELLADYPAIYIPALRDRAASPEAFDEYVKNPWSLYLELPFSNVDVTGDGGAGGYELSTRGLTVGLDHSVGDHAITGVSVGFAGSKADVTGGGKVDTRSLGVDLYGLWFRRGLHLFGMVGGTSSSFDTKRPTLGGIASGNTKGLSWTGLAGGGFDVGSGGWKAGLQAAVQYESAGIDQFTETESLAPLRLPSQRATAVHSQVGLNLRYRRLMPPWTIVTPHLYFGWRHELEGDLPSVKAQAASGAGSVFTVNGSELGTDSIIGSAGLSIQWRPTMNTFLNFTKQVGRTGYESRNMQLGTRLSF